MKTLGVQAPAARRRSVQGIAASGEFSYEIRILERLPDESRWIDTALAG